MNDILKIKKWIENPADYAVGLELYMKYKPNNKYDEFFNRHKEHPTAVALNLLKERLIFIQSKLLLSPNYLEEKVIENATRQRVVTKMETPSLATKHIKQGDKVMGEQDSTALGKVDPKNLPEHLAASYARIQDITLLMGGVHANLKAAKDQDQAYKLVVELEALDTEKRNLWKLIDKYYKTPPMDVVVQDMSEEELKKRIKNVKDTIRRIEKRIPGQEKTNPRLAKNSKKNLAKKQEELRVLTEQLDGKAEN